jgi:DNA excision repair protein ERCC-1
MPEQGNSNGDNSNDLNKERTDSILQSIQSMKSAAGSGVAEIPSRQKLQLPKKTLPLPSKPQPTSTASASSSSGVVTSLRNVQSLAATTATARPGSSNANLPSLGPSNPVSLLSSPSKSKPDTFSNQQPPKDSSNQSKLAPGNLRNASNTVTPNNSNASTSSTPPISQQTLGIKRNRAFDKRNVIVSPRQKGNPLLNNIVSVPWEWGDILADYLPSPASCVLFLSLRYHRLHPEYIQIRMAKLLNAESASSSSFQQLKVLLVQVDIEAHADALRELTLISMAKGFTILLAWNEIEAGMYISLLKNHDGGTAKAIQGQVKTDYETLLTDAMSKIRGVNKKDGLSLITEYESLKNAIEDGGRTLESLDGWGGVKVKRFRDAVTQPFIYNKIYPNHNHQPQQESPTEEEAHVSGTSSNSSVPVTEVEEDIF